MRHVIYNNKLYEFSQELSNDFRLFRILENYQSEKKNYPIFLFFSSFAWFLYFFPLFFSGIVVLERLVLFDKVFSYFLIFWYYFTKGWWNNLQNVRHENIYHITIGNVRWLLISSFITCKVISCWVYHLAPSSDISALEKIGMSSQVLISITLDHKRRNQSVGWSVGWFKGTLMQIWKSFYMSMFI